MSSLTFGRLKVFLKKNYHNFQCLVGCLYLDTLSTIIRVLMGLKVV